MYRKEGTKFIIDLIGKLPNGKANAELYEETLGAMSDKEFEALVVRCEEEEFIFPIFVPNMEGKSINVESVMKVGESIGVEFFQELILTDHVTGSTYQTPVKYLVLDVGIRRLIQHLIEKLSTADSNRVVDHLAGQATGESKSASMSLPELVVLGGKNLKYTQLEQVKVKGGDDAAFDAMNRSIEESGEFSLGPIIDADTRPKAVETLKYLLLQINIDSEGLGGFDVKQ